MEVNRVGLRFAECVKVSKASVESDVATGRRRY